MERESEQLVRTFESSVNLHVIRFTVNLHAANVRTSSSGIYIRLRQTQDPLVPFSSGLRPNKQTFNPADTNALVAAVAFGKGLSNWRPSGGSGPGQPGQQAAGTILAGASGLQQVQMAGAPSQQQPMLSGVQMAQGSQPGKSVRDEMALSRRGGG